MWADRVREGLKVITGKREPKKKLTLSNSLKIIPSRKFFNHLRWERVDLKDDKGNEFTVFQWWHVDNELSPLITTKRLLRITRVEQMRVLELQTQYWTKESTMFPLWSTTRKIGTKIDHTFRTNKNAKKNLTILAERELKLWDAAGLTSRAIQINVPFVDKSSKKIKKILTTVAFHFVVTWWKITWIRLLTAYPTKNR